MIAGYRRPLNYMSTNRKQKKFVGSGGSRGGARGLALPPLFWVTKEENGQQGK